MLAYISKLNAWFGKLAAYTVLAVVLLCVATAILRKFGIGSNALLELQWYLFSLVFLLSAGHCLANDEHVRVNVLSQHLKPYTRSVIDLLGHVLFLLPLSLVLCYLSGMDAWQVWQSAERSADAGGLLRWPVKALIPLGFLLLALQTIVSIVLQWQAIHSNANNGSSTHG